MTPQMGVFCFLFVFISMHLHQLTDMQLSILYQTAVPSLALFDHTLCKDISGGTSVSPHRGRAAAPLPAG